LHITEGIVDISGCIIKVDESILNYFDKIDWHCCNGDTKKECLLIRSSDYCEYVDFSDIYTEIYLLPNNTFCKLVNRNKFKVGSVILANNKRTRHTIKNIFDDGIVLFEGEGSSYIHLIDLQLFNDILVLEEN